jgi:hypothetical protein
VKDYCDDDLAALSGLAKEDEGVKDLCNQLSKTASHLRSDERRCPELFAAPVDPRFLTAWRDFEERFERPLAFIWLADLLPEVGNTDPEHASEADFQWENADHDASEKAHAIEAAIDFAYETAFSEEFLDENFCERINDASAAWHELKDNVGFDLQGVFRRRELVPFVLVPRHVSAKEGSAQRLSMLKNLQQAHDAFVFGAPLAALALMRSILEAVLRDHYGAEGKKSVLRTPATGYPAEQA